MIMGTVFAAFILTADRISKEFGLLLAVAILTDALVVRMTLVPAFFTLLGREDLVHPALARPPASEHHDRAAARRRGATRRSTSKERPSRSRARPDELDLRELRDGVSATSWRRIPRNSSSLVGSASVCSPCTTTFANPVRSSIRSSSFLKYIADVQPVVFFGLQRVVAPLLGMYLHGHLLAQRIDFHNTGTQRVVGTVGRSPSLAGRLHGFRQ